MSIRRRCSCSPPLACKPGSCPGRRPQIPASPNAAGGYLGADNQLVRVTVTAFDPSKNTGTLLWGWNNASLLYRASVTNPSVLTLTGTPVDEEHAPQLGQAVEILRTRSDLTDGNYIAAPEGFVTTIAQAYSFDTGQLTLTDALPNAYRTDKTPLFVRLWQESVPFVGGQATALDNVSGITVTLTLPAVPTSIALRPVWRFSVRPSTPVQIYPQRYLDAPQPPDGPRQWMIDLAIVNAAATGITVVDDCRPPFPTAGGCCCLTLGPTEIDVRGGMQAVIDGLGRSGCLSLKPGIYTLQAPLLLTEAHAGLTLDGCGPGVSLVASTANPALFAFGMIILERATAVTLRGLTFDLPIVQSAAAAPTASVANANAAAPNSTNAATGAATAAAGATSIGVFAVSAIELTVEECVFISTGVSANLIGAGVVLFGDASGTSIRRNRFTSANYVSGAALYGVLATTLQGRTPTTLDAADISDNVFQSLGAGVFCYGQLGFIRVGGNRVTQCATGLYFASSALGATTELVRQASTDTTQATQLAPALVGALQPALLSNVLSQTAPLATKVPAVAAPTSAARTALLQDITTRAASTYRAVVPAPVAATTVSVAPVAATTISNAAVAATTIAGAATGATTTSGATTGATAAPAADPKLSAELDAVRAVSVDAEINGETLAPVLHIAGNDVSLIATGGTAGVGIAVLFSISNVSHTALMTANRVLVPDTNTVAGAVVVPNFAAVTGNVFLQPAAVAGTAGPTPAFVMLGAATAHIEVSANVIVNTAAVLPARSTAAATTSWPFLNTIG